MSGLESSRGSSRIRAASASTHVVGQRRAQQRRAVGPAIGRGAERHCDAKQIEQISEVRVMAEHRVAVDRPRQHLVDREGGADRGNHQRVHVSPQPADDRLELLEPLQCGERVDRGVLLAAAQDLPDHGMDRLRLGSKEIREFDQPFRHPRPLIQQGSGGQERLQRIRRRRWPFRRAAHGRPGGRGASRRRRRTPARRRAAARPGYRSRRTAVRDHATTHRCRLGRPSRRRPGRHRRCSRPSR